MDRQEKNVLTGRNSQAKCREVNQSDFPCRIINVTGTRMEEIIPCKGLHREKLEIFQVTTRTAKRSQRDRRSSVKGDAC